jgi:hypothetical protein
MGKVRDHEEVGGGDHPRGCTRAELLDLLMNVVKEGGITGPSSKKHDGEDGDASQVHSHHCTRSNEVAANLMSLET